jgi:hypothetical protein
MSPTATEQDEIQTLARGMSRDLQRYAKRFAAGAFATPLPAELETAYREGRVLLREGVIAVGKALSRDSKRKDFTGRTYLLPQGSLVLTHLAVEPGATVPDLDGWDFVYAYLDDLWTCDQLRRQGREVRAVRVSAASELIGCFGRPGSGHAYPVEEAATFTRIPFAVPGDLRSRIRREVEAVSEWHDDFPYYSDGSWDAVSLRGFDDDPRIGVKPREMGKNWWKDNPDVDPDAPARWTSIADRMPATLTLLNETPWFGELERVRLLRMQGRGGKEGHLGRHTDVGDPDAGVNDGQIARFHLPIITHPDVEMTCWGLNGRPMTGHLLEWNLWYLDARKPHSVANRSGIDRVHLVIDVFVTEAVRQKIRAGEETYA